MSAEMISGQFGVGYFTWDAYEREVLADRRRHDHDRGSGHGVEPRIRLAGTLLTPWRRAWTRPGRDPGEPHWTGRIEIPDVGIVFGPTIRASRPFAGSS